MTTTTDLSGQRFGSFLAVGFGDKDRFGHPRFICQCDCGNRRLIRTNDLLRGRRVSCGCRLASSVGLRAGWSKRPEYRVWCAMKGRCLNPNDQGWPLYGGRGIKVCERWLTFANFLSDMGTRPEGTSIDRIDHDGDYEPGNCRWATAAEQTRNQRSNHWVLVNGEPMLIADAARFLKVSHVTIHKRIKSGKIASLGHGKRPSV